ncbi:hypothetical protein NIES4071_31140 [Calothrix sp. NIES-4071]|nr:hypothetical protein NIES4071_31140 [Calothrix sp. NIES-4071]BAZ57434.1 hypothetical protein NIES4105_31080 [Calothrix sp. NIES-4105]
MNDVISENHIQALQFIIPIFEQNDITYRITGGLAGNLYGSLWELHDIDLEVAQKDIELVAELFKEYIAIDLMRLVDDEFDLLMMTLVIHGVDIEINQAEEAFIYHDDTPVKLDDDLSAFHTFYFEGLKLKVKPLKQIIEYKQLLGRHNDVIDLITLT